jgi:hypothetical protein
MKDVYAVQRIPGFMKISFPVAHVERFKGA